MCMVADHLANDIEFCDQTNDSENFQSLNRHNFVVCETCNGSGWIAGRTAGRHPIGYCIPCDGVGFFGIDGSQPCPAKPGTRLKAAFIVVRERDGLPIWHPGDAPLLDSLLPLSEQEPADEC